MKNKLNFITKSFLVKTFAVLMILGMMDSAAFSQTQTRINFARGRTSKTIKGNVSALVPDEYVINGRRGQTMTIRVSSTNGQVRVGVGGNVSKEVTVKLDSNQDYEFSVYNAYSRDYSDYSLYVSIK